MCYVPKSVVQFESKEHSIAKFALKSVIFFKILKRVIAANSALSLVSCIIRNIIPIQIGISYVCKSILNLDNAEHVFVILESQFPLKYLTKILQKMNPPKTLVQRF